jgi:hypothetical protein
MRESEDLLDRVSLPKDGRRGSVCCMNSDAAVFTAVFLCFLSGKSSPNASALGAIGHEGFYG